MEHGSHLRPEWVVESVSVPLFVIDAKHKVIFWNKAMENLTGVASEDILDTGNHWKPFYEQYHPTLADVLADGRQDELPNYYENYSTSELIPGAYQAEGWRINSTRYLLFTATPILDEEGKLIAVIETIQDATDVAISEERYRNIVDNASDLIMLLNKRGSIIFENDKVTEVLGYMPQEILGLPFMDYVSEKDKETVEKALKASCEGGPDIKNLQAKLSKKGGQNMYAEITASCVKHGGKTTGLQMVVRDVTERKKAEELVKKELEQLRELDALKDDFLSITAHEMKTPLISILNVPDLMLDDDNLTKDQRENLNILLAEGRMLKKIIDSILIESRMKAGRLEYDLRECDMKALVEEKMKVFDLRANEKGVELEDKVPHDLVHALADENLTGEVVANLIDNALKFTPKDGAITVSAEEKNEKIVVSVKDTGIGLEQEQKEKVFEKFYQVEHRDDRRYGGTGLGLAICRNLVESQGGRIWVESEKGAGSTFYFTLPIYKQ